MDIEQFFQEEQNKLDEGTRMESNEQFHGQHAQEMIEPVNDQQNASTIAAERRVRKRKKSSISKENGHTNERASVSKPPRTRLQWAKYESLKLNNNL